MIAKLIGEKSAGMTAVEIYNGDDLVWSHMYFGDGATHQGYIDGLCQVARDMLNCQDVGQYEGCDLDDNDEPVNYDTTDTTGVIAEYNSETHIWTVGARYGQSDEILNALIWAGLVKADAEYDPESAESDVVSAVYDAITE